MSPAHHTPAAGRQAPPLSLWPGDPEHRRRRLLRRRAALERVVEKAIARLDRLDGDPDIEPSLGAAEWTPASGGEWWRLHNPDAFTWSRGASDDREADGGRADADFETLEEDEDDGTAEPDLAAPEGSQDFGRSRSGCNDDREGDDGPHGDVDNDRSDFELDVDAEPDADGEPSLAWPEGAQHGNGSRVGGQDEREAQCEDEGHDSDREPDTDAEPWEVSEGGI